MGENLWYFFCLRGRKYQNSVRPNRVTGSGYWKATGIDKKIIFPHGTNNCIGLKKSLVYYYGKGGKGTKTHWMMHEFRLPPKGNEISNNPKTISADESYEAENWTICRIFERSPSPPKKSPRQSIPTPTEDAISTSCVVEFNDSQDQILEEQHEIPVEQVLDQFAEEKCSSSSLLDKILSENPDSSFVFPDAINDFGGTNWGELGSFMESSTDFELVYF